MTTEKKGLSAQTLYKIFIYVVLITLAVLIIVPVAWVFLASIKQNSEFYGNPWALPAGFYWQNFVDAWNSANMGSYMLNSVLVTALSLALLLVVALPAAYCLARFRFKGRGPHLPDAPGRRPVAEKDLGQPLPDEQPLCAGGGLRLHRPALYHLPPLRLLRHPAPRF